MRQEPGKWKRVRGGQTKSLECEGNTTLANRRTYDSFGDLKSQTSAAVEHLFAYTGRFLDELTGDQNHLHRWYDPDIAQWLSEDPIGFASGDANLKRYVGNSPANRTDRHGLYVDGNFPGSFHVYAGSLDSRDFLGTVSYDPGGGAAHRAAARQLAERLEWRREWFGTLTVPSGTTASDAQGGLAAAEVAAWLKKHPDAVYGPPPVESSIAVYGRGSNDRCRIHSITLSRPFGAAITDSMAAAMFGFSSRPGGGLAPQSEDEYSDIYPYKSQFNSGVLGADSILYRWVGYRCPDLVREGY